MRKSHFLIIGLICILASGMIVNDDMLAYAMTDIEDFVDNNSSDIDISPDIGSHSNFPAEKAHDSSFDTLTETLTVTPPIEDFVDNNSSNVDGISDVGIHSNFTNMKAKDDIYDALNESGGSIIYENSAESYSAAGTSSHSFTYSLQKDSGNDRLVIVTVSWEDNSSLASVTSCTFNSVAMTKIADVTSTTGFSTYVSLWYLLDSSLPSSSGSYTIAVIGSELISREIYVGVAEYSGVKQSAPDDYDTHSIASAGNTQVTLTAATDNSLVVAGVGEGDINVLTNTNNLAVLQLELLTSSGSAIGHNFGVNSGDITIGWNNLAVRGAMVGAVWQPATQDYHLNLEVQFTNVTDFLATESLCIYAGAFDTSEDIGVYEWDGSQWQFLGNLTASSWNNFTVSYLTSSNYTIKFQGWNETGDSEQSSWQIDATLLRLEDGGHSEIAVQNQYSDVDGSEDQGLLIDFANMTAYDTYMASFSEGWMISRDNATQGQSFTASVSFSHQIDYSAGNGRLIVVAAGYEHSDQATAPAFTTATFGGQSMTKIGEIVTPNMGYCAAVTLFYILDADMPSSSGEYTVVVTCSGDPSADLWGAAVSYLGVNQSAPNDWNAYAQNSDPGEATNTLNSAADGSMLVQASIVGNTGDFTPSTGTTEVIEDQDINSASSVFNEKLNQGTGSRTIGTDHNSANRQAWIGACWAPTSAGDYRLDREVQWTNIPSNMPNANLSIYTGSTGAEDILVDAWNGTGWENLFDDLTADSWNNISISDHLISSTFTIRFRDGDTTGDTTTQDSWEIDVALLHFWIEDTVYKLDLEVQFEEPLYADEYYEELCIKTGTFSGTEDLLVDVWDGSQWQEVSSGLTQTAWNNISVSSYLISSTENFTIRYRGGSETSDNNQDQWQIDAVLLHTWTPFDQEPPNISWGSNQFANDTGSYDVQIDIDAVDVYYGSGIGTVWYRIWNVSASDWVPGYHNISLSSPDYETNIDVSTWHPSLEYYVEAFTNDTGGYENATQNITGDEYRYFTIVHSIIVSQPTVSYTGDSIQEIDITGVTASCSYVAHGTVQGYTEAQNYTYTIYTSDGEITSITGNLLWTGSSWERSDVDVSSLPDGTYYVKCYFKESGEIEDGTSTASNTFTKSTSNGGGGNGGGGGDGSSDGSGGDGGDGTSTSTFILDFLNNFYGTKPGETVTLSGTISSNENGKLITITLDGETYTAYTYNNGEFEVTLTAPNTYGSYTVTAKFAGDSNWESTSTTCQLLVVEEGTQITIDIDGNLDIGDQVTIQVVLESENGDPLPGEEITIYIYERKNSVSTSSFLMSSSVGVFSADTRYWDLIATFEITTNENSEAIIDFTISTDHDIQIVAEYAGKIEGEGGANLGPSIATYVEGETGQRLFVFMPSEMWYLFGGIVATVLVIGLVVVVKSKVIIQREEIIDETIILSKEMLDPTRYGVKAVLMVAFDPVVGPMIKESRFFDFQVNFFDELKDPAKLTLFYSMSSTKEQFKLEEMDEFIFVKSASTLIINEADMTVLGESVAPNLFMVITKKGCNENFVWKFLNTVLIEWSDQQGYHVLQLDRLNSKNMIDLGVLSLF